MISFNNTNIPQNYRPRDNIHPAQFLQPLQAARSPLSFTHNTSFRTQQRRPNPEGEKGSVSMLELSQDLNRLKEQLKKLADQGEQHQQYNSQYNQQDGVQRVRPKSIFYTSSQSNLRPFNLSETVLSPNHRETDVSINLSREGQKEKRNQKKQEPSRFVPIKKEIKGEPEQINTLKGGPISYFGQEKENFEKEIKELRDRIAFLEKDLNDSRIEKNRLETELRSTIQKLQMVEIGIVEAREDKRTSQLEGQWVKEKEQYQQIISKLQDQLAKSSKAATISTSTFDQAIREEILKSEKLKKALDEKDEQLLTVRGVSAEQLKTIDDLRSQLSIQEIKIRSQSNNKIQLLEIQVNEQKNEVQSGKRALQCLEARYRAALKEVDQKDQFIRKYLVSRSNATQQGEIARFFEQYKSAFSVPPTLELFLQEQRQSSGLFGK